MEGDSGRPKLMTEREVAKRLHCSTEKVKRLRLGGKLAYYRGRPVLIAEADVAAYLESIRVARELKERAPPPKTEAEQWADARLWVRKKAAARGGNYGWKLNPLEEARRKLRKGKI